MSKKLTKLLNSDLSYKYEEKEAFHREGKRVLRALAKALGLAPGTFNVRSNKGGIAVSGEVTLHADNFYLQISQSCLGPGGEILLRTCKNQKDYTGGPNNFLPASALENIDKVCTGIKRLTNVPTLDGPGAPK